MDYVIENQRVSIYDPKTQKVIEQSLIRAFETWTILFFYPNDFSVICPTELHALNEMYDECEQLGVKILVISRDSNYTHKHWIESDEQLQGFQIEMISDRDGDIAGLFNFPIIDEKTKEYERATVILDRKGTICYYEINPQKVGRNVSEYLKKIKALNYVKNNEGVLCPEGWEEDDEIVNESITKEIERTSFVQ